MTWYVVACDWYRRSRYVSDPRDLFQDGDNQADRYIWTLSENPDEEGWNTDGGCNGYGLTYAKAKELADAANGALGRTDER